MSFRTRNIDVYIVGTWYKSRGSLPQGYPHFPFDKIYLENPRKVHPWRLTWNLIMEVWKIIFLSKWLICRFHVHFPGCTIFVRQLDGCSFRGPKLMEINKPPGSFALSSRWGLLDFFDWTTLCFYGWRKKSCKPVGMLPNGSKLGGGFKYVLFSSLFGEDSQFD